MNLAVVIPAWNEGAWLPRLFESLRSSDIGCHVVVADNDSTDNTRTVALRNGAAVIRGGLPAVGRNLGARAAKGETLLFLDADVVVPRTTLYRAISVLAEPGMVAVHARLDPLSADKFVRSCYWLMHVYFTALNHLNYPQGVGSFILVRRSAFEAVGGFREHVAVGEDADFFRRIRRMGRVAYLEDPIFVSARRMRLENSFLFAGKCILWAVLRFLGSTVSLLSYRWVTYPRSFANDEEACVPNDLMARVESSHERRAL